MTKQAQEEAYARGFCKVAEAYGVDPRELMKTAQWLNKVTRGVKRFGNLLAGGNREAIKGEINTFKSALEAGKNAAREMAQHPGLDKSLQLYSRDGARIMLGKSYATVGDARDVMRSAWDAVAHRRLALRSENAKVLAARAGLAGGAAGLTGAGAAGYYMGRNDG